MKKGTLTKGASAHIYTKFYTPKLRRVHKAKPKVDRTGELAAVVMDRRVLGTTGEGG